jgi:hypothetical protein
MLRHIGEGKKHIVRDLSQDEGLQVTTGFRKTNENKCQVNQSPPKIINRSPSNTIDKQFIVDTIGQVPPYNVT